MIPLIPSVAWVPGFVTQLYFEAAEEISYSYTSRLYRRCQNGERFVRICVITFNATVDDNRKVRNQDVALRWEHRWANRHGWTENEK